jgi:hypothetical protein
VFYLGQRDKNACLLRKVFFHFFARIEKYFAIGLAHSDGLEPTAARHNTTWQDTATSPVMGFPTGAASETPADETDIATPNASFLNAFIFIP